MKNETYKGHVIRFKKFRGFGVLGEVNVFKSVVERRGLNKPEVLEKLKKDIDAKIEDVDVVLRSMYD